MRVIISTFSIVVSLTVVNPSAAQTGQPPSKYDLRACDVLTRDLVAKYDTGNPKMRDLIPRSAEPTAKNGSSCHDGSILIQLDPFPGSSLRTSPPKDWVAISGVGETAYFHNNRNNYAELMAWTGKHHFTIQLSVPSGSTAEAVKPNTIGLATALVAKLKSM